MLPWFALYDHSDYARWGPVYLVDMKQLESTAPDVHREFMTGQFSITNISRKLCEVATYQAQEHINKVAKVSDGIVGIPQRDSTRDQWCLA